MQIVIWILGCLGVEPLQIAILRNAQVDKSDLVHWSNLLRDYPYYLVHVWQNNWEAKNNCQDIQSEFIQNKGKLILQI